MKVFLLALLFSFSAQSGDLNFYTESSYVTISNCEITFQTQEYIHKVNKYWLSCGDESITPIVNSGLDHTTIVYVNGVLKFACLGDATIYQDDFDIYLNCGTNKLFKSGFQSN